jgi:serine phosphatase RsbU (regulator of sigma subunit)
MVKLLENLDCEVLGSLVERFAQAAGGSVRIVGADGKLLAGSSRPAGQIAAEPIVIDGEHVGAIILAGKAGPDGADENRRRLLGLMADVLKRLCGQARELRDRVEELAAMYKVTEVFTGKRDLKQVHQLVAETMVKVTGADACSIRVLSEDCTELLTIAACGLSGRYMDKGPILLSASRIDQEVISTGEPVYIADERKDPRVLYKAEARREGIVSALCVPMSYRGDIEGVIRVYTRTPHAFDWFETSLIRGVAGMAASAIVNARLYTEALEAEGIKQQLRMAAEVQRRMIPPAAPRFPGLDIGAIYVPCFELGGDFYDFIELPNGNLGVAVADVVGKGVRASLLMASARSALRAYVQHIYELSAVLGSLNRHICRESQERDFVTMFYGVIDVPKGRLTYCNAGHEPALLIRQGQAAQLAGGAGGVLGMDRTMEYRHSSLELRGGDVLLLFTDGLPEARNFGDEAFNRQRARQAALAACRLGSSADAIGKHLLWQMRRFTGLQTRCDDLTLVTIKVQ